MKYNLHFKPSEEIAGLIGLEDALKGQEPRLGYHCTVMNAFINPDNEQGYISALRRISFKPFRLVTACFGKFDNDSLVLRLADPEVFNKEGLIRTPHTLEALHKEAARVTEHYAVNSEQFRASSKAYFFHNYKPHITIGRIPEEEKYKVGFFTLSKAPEFDMKGDDAKVLLGLEFEVQTIYLSRTADVIDKVWEEVARFKAKH